MQNGCRNISGETEADMSKKEQSTWSRMEELLKKSLGAEEGAKCLVSAKQKSAEWLAGTKETSESRLKMMRETIIPRIAVYAVLKENGADADAALGDYVRNVAGPAMHKTYAKAEKLPGFWAIFKNGFTSVTRKSDFWQCENRKEKNRFSTDIHKCLWYDTCVECGYPEVCRFFCDCDNYTYGGLNKIAFTRTKTLGTGGDKCDFVFYKKQRDR